MTIRLVIEGTAKDYAAYLATIKKYEEHVKRMPGLVSVEGFINPETCRFLWLESWADADALMGLITGMQENGLFNEIVGVSDFDNMISLEPSDDPRVNALVDQFGGTLLEKFSELTR